MTEHVYVATRAGLVKVGIAVNPSRRVRQQRAQMFWCSVPCDGAAWVEYAACRAMRRRVVIGKREWFHVRPAVAVRVVLRAMARSLTFRPLSAAIGVSKSLIYQRARGEWAQRIAEGAGADE